MNETAQKLRELADMIDSGEIQVKGFSEDLNAVAEKAAGMRIDEDTIFHVRYTSKPKTRTVHNVHTGEASEVPKPLSVKPKEGEDYWLIHNVQGETTATNHTWMDDKTDNSLFRGGNCFATEDDAIANRDAMLGKPE